MLYFVTAAAAYIAILLVFSLPVIIVARRNRRRHHGADRRVAIAAILLGLFCAIVGATSRQLVGQCEAVERNKNCFDAGADGLLATLLIGYLIFSVGRAYLMFND